MARSRLGHGFKCCKEESSSSSSISSSIVSSSAVSSSVPSGDCPCLVYSEKFLAFDSCDPQEDRIGAISIDMSPTRVCGNQTFTISFTIRNETGGTWTSSNDDMYVYLAVINTNGNSCTSCSDIDYVSASPSPLRTNLTGGNVGCAITQIDWSINLGNNSETSYSATFNMGTICNCTDPVVFEVGVVRGCRATLSAVCDPCQPSPCISGCQVNKPSTATGSGGQFWNILSSTYNTTNGNWSLVAVSKSPTGVGASSFSSGQVSSTGGANAAITSHVPAANFGGTAYPIGTVVTINGTSTPPTSGNCASWGFQLVTYAIVYLPAAWTAEICAGDFIPYHLVNLEVDSSLFKNSRNVSTGIGLLSSISSSGISLNSKKCCEGACVVDCENGEVIQTIFDDCAGRISENQEPCSCQSNFDPNVCYGKPDGPLVIKCGFKNENLEYTLCEDS
jgi:hypothetical protein